MVSPQTAQSSQDFVKALKSSSDPPHKNGPLKISFARKAWDDTTFYVPNKDQVIAEWLLNKLLKDKANEPSANPLLQVQYWSLLADITCAQTFKSGQTKTWLTALIKRVPLTPIVLSLLSLLSGLDQSRRITITPQIRRAVTLLWPLGVQKVTGDVLLECFGETLKLVNVFCEEVIEDEHLVRLCGMVTTSFRTSFGNASNKKKTYQTFMHTYLLQWVQCAYHMRSNKHPPTSDLISTLLSNIVSTGTDVVFTPDIIRQNLDNLHTLSPNPELTSTPSLLSTLSTFDPSHHPKMIPIIPHVFDAFMSSIRKHRGVLFPQSHSAPANADGAVLMRRTSKKFFVGCMSLLKQTQEQHLPLTWQAYLGLLDTVLAEKLFASTGQKDDDAEEILKIVIEDAILALLDQQTQPVECNKLTIRALSKIIEIDFDLVKPFIPKMLPKLLFVNPQANDDASHLQNLLLDYHAKTRTVNDHISALLTAVASLSGPSAEIKAIDARTNYISAFSSALLSKHQLQRLAQSTRNFITPSQTPDLISRIVMTALRDTWNAFRAAQEKTDAVESSEGARKKRKIQMAELQTAIGFDDPDMLVVSFALTARISGSVLDALPLHTLPELLRHEVLEVLREFNAIFFQPTLNKMFQLVTASLTTAKPSFGRGRGDEWAIQIGIAALLRLEYTLLAAEPLQLHLAREDSHEVSQKMLDIAMSEGMLPELSIEMFRSLLSFSSEGSLDVMLRHGVLNVLLDYLELNLKVSTSWGGLLCTLTFGKLGRGESALALLHIIMDRWLPIIDLVASPGHLERIARILLALAAHPEKSTSNHTGLEAGMILMRALQSAQFWELVHMRDAVMLMLNTETLRLEDSNLVGAASSLKAKPKTSAKGRNDTAGNEILHQSIPIYELLQYVPTEYLTRVLRRDLVRRAMAADYLACQAELKDEVHALFVLRTFSASLPGLVDYAAAGAFVQHLMVWPNMLTAPTPELQNVTLQLVEMNFMTLLRSTEKEAIESTMNVLIFLSEANVFLAPLVEDSKSSLMQRGIMRLFELLSRDFTSTSLPDVLVSALRALHDEIHAAISPRISALALERQLIQSTAQSFVVYLWKILLSFGRWLQSERDVRFIGCNLVSKVLKTANILTSPFPLGDLCITSTGILFEEIYFQSEAQRPSHLDVIIASYVAFGRISGYHTWAERLDACVSKACKGLNHEDLSHILDLCLQSISSSSLSAADKATILQLSALLLRSAPQGALKIIQAFTTSCFNLFSDNPAFYSGPLALRVQVMAFVVQHCSERPAALRPLDLGSIWLLLSNVFSGSEEHDEDTSTTIFYHLIAAISAVIRLRRDLVVNTLPHLGMILRQLLLIIRQVRPQLGGKQTKLVTNTLPLWMNGHQPLGAEEGNAIARLLTTLVTKSFVRSHQHTTSLDTQKAESLAKPFSKHAAYVLKAYIEAVNDPLCIVPFHLRKDIQPGLYSLCDMMSEYSRDALMVSALDAGGKTTMKVIWNEYEKQKYVGKG